MPWSPLFETEFHRLLPARAGSYRDPLRSGVKDFQIQKWGSRLEVTGSIANGAA